MDYEGRIVKLEVTMNMLKEELTLLREQMHLLDGKVESFRVQTYQRMDDLRDHIDAMRDHIDTLRDHLDAARDHTDTLRYHVDRRFDAVHAELVELRRDHTRLIYWVAGFTIANLIATAGWILKSSGVF